MSGQITEYIEAYLLHDPIGNTEGVIAEFDTEKLVAAEQQGAVFIAVYSTGRREIAKAAEITRPEAKLNGVTLVQPVYVDDRFKAVVDVFEALEPFFTAVPMAMSDGVEMTFSEALTALKSIVYGTGE